MNLTSALPAHRSPSTSETPAEPLVGRSALLSALIDLIPRTGSGSVPGVMLTGPVGIGRSAVLRAFCDLVPPQTSVLRAGLADGTWYDSLGAARGHEPPGRHPRAEGPLSCHQLHETVVALCRRGPVVLAVDDAHLSRPQTLRALDYVLRRSLGLPLLPVITAAPVAEPPALVSLLTHHAWTTVALAPLPDSDIAELLTRRLGHTPCPVLLRACLERSEGIPSAVHAFVDRHSGAQRATGDGTGPTAYQSPEALPSSASTVLSAVAVLGCSDAELVSELIRMPLPAVRRALDHLTERRLLPLPPGAPAEGPTDHVPDGLSGDDLIPLYARAARLLEDAGRPPAQVADVLLRIRYGGAPWMLETLYSAALSAASPRAAVRYLSHALDIGAGENTRMLRRIRALLADTLSTTAPNLAVHHLSTLLTSSTDGHELAAIALRYADTLVVLGRGDDAARLLADVLEHRPGSGKVVVPPDCRPALESALLLTGALGPETMHWVRERSRMCGEPVGNSPGDRRLRLARAALSVLSGRPVSEPPRPPAVEGPGTPLDDLSLIASAVVTNLTDDNTTALETLDRLLANPLRGELDPSRIHALTVRALVLSATGDLPAAERDSRHALELERRRGGPAVTSAVVFAYVLAQRGTTAAAAAVLSQVDCAELRRLSYIHPVYYWATAAVRRARDDLRGALIALRASGRALGPQGAESPLVLPWWLEAADLLTELGRPAEARQVAAQGGALGARSDTPRGAGLILLARGLATPGRAGHRLLDDACARLAESPARLLRARAEYALGAALLDDGDPLAARPRLRTALDLMIGCGAGNAAEGIRLRLTEAGGRPRRLTNLPDDALTARERRVAALAMAGRSNREIAEALYITRRTVELHLTHTYQKLGVSGREELPDVLRAPSRPRATRAREGEL
ncbi:LuxR C-terminal-related transcriptional regulator [Streptomyces sp. NBC_00582]|uniref:LuxR C-terminal-related transcriptional regulator n=1 Tax=Streptomyces sp. NBC_00582 TaxID=2975783 RepID=UPI002E81135B|nr:LuxR C-terminal-related transcriptional regulator [Streptomyces sp. NBC_00582]WUB59483.1 LuxR C-terminal-related transcriptional regulator [Streptomyces sp. NBC_00582]